MSTPGIELDGSFGEGGGQILRTSLALSLLTGKSFHLKNVRANREKPGLQPQHLMSVRAAATIGNAQLQGDKHGSKDLIFEPGEIEAGSYRFDIGTAGATGLVLHTIALPLCLGANAASEVTLIGGTHVRTSPCYHFLEATWRRYLAACGCLIDVELTHPGFYPRGGGEVRAIVKPTSKLNGLSLTSRNDVRVTGFSAVAGLPDHIAKRQARRATFRLEQLGLDVDIEQEQWQGGPGSVIGLTLDTKIPTFFFGLGARGKPAEKVADEAVDQVAAYVASENGTVDRYSADQLVLPLALAEGSSTYCVAEITQHLLTNIDVVKRFLDREIICEGDEGSSGIVEIK